VDRVGAGLEVVATAPDGIIETLAVVDRPSVMAVQWYSERTATDDDSQQKLFDQLVEQVRKKMEQKRN